MTYNNIVTDTKMNCNVLTWNVRGAMSSAGSISYLLDKYNIDIACIIEHKLKPITSSFLDTIHGNYKALTVCDESLVKCGKGGVSILYKKSLAFSTKSILNTNSHRIVGIQLYCENMLPVYIFSIYMPSVNYIDEEYKECLDNLQSLYDTYSSLGTVLLCAD